MKPVPDARDAAPPLLTPVVLDALSLEQRHVSRVATLPGIDVLWVAESVREAREVLDRLGEQVAVIDLGHPFDDARAMLEAIERAGGDAFTVVVTAADAPDVHRIRTALAGGAFLCRSSRIGELPKLLREIADAWS